MNLLLHHNLVLTLAFLKTSLNVTVYSFEVLRTRYVKTGYFFDTNTKELQNVRV